GGPGRARTGRRGRTACHRRSTRGSRSTPRATDRRRAPASGHAVPDSTRRAPWLGSSDRPPTARRSRTRARAGRRGGAPCSSCPRPRSCRGAPEEPKRRKPRFRNGSPARIAASRQRSAPVTMVLVSVAIDLLAGRGEHVPARAEVRQAFAVRLTALAVTGEEIQRVPRIGDLTRSAGPADAPEQCRLGSLDRDRLTARDQRRPVARAHARAGTLAAFVLLEQVERATATV